MPKEEEIKESEGEVEEEEEDFGGGMSSAEFAQFLQSSGTKGAAPVLDKVEEFREVEFPVKLEQDLGLGDLPVTEQEEPLWETQKVVNEPAYIMGKENPYHVSQAKVESSALAQQHIPKTVTLPEGYMRRELFDPTWAASGFAPPRTSSYPNQIGQGKIDNKSTGYEIWNYYADKYRSCGN